MSARGATTRAAPTKAAPLVLRLNEVAKNERSLAGGKVVNLAVLLRAGLPVPRGFCVTTAAFGHFLEACPGGVRLVHPLSQCSPDQARRIGLVSREIEASLKEVGVPSVVKESVLAAWREFGPERSLAVRSSATIEDAPERSFAGQFESILNVRGADALLEAIRHCWLSLFSERALAYMIKQAAPLEKVKMAVLVQEMIAADWSGVVFTADPLTGADDRLVVEYVRGLGDGLVQGTVQPERMVLEKRSGRVLALPSDEPRSGSREKAANLSGGLPAAAAAEPSESTEKREPGLSSATLARLFDLARQTERLFGTPQDIEWAQRDGELFLLQARPITGKAAVRSWEDRQVWTNLNTGEGLPDVTTPITWSLLQQFFDPLFRSIFRLHGADISSSPVAGLVAGRVYFNANTGMAAIKPFSFLINRIPNVAQALGGGQIEESRRLLQSMPDEDLPDLGFRWRKYLLSWPRILRNLISHSPRRGDAWTVRLKARLDELVRVDVETMSTPELAQFFTQLLQDSFDDWDLLYLVTQAAVLPVFQMACRDWLDDPGLTLGYRLFSGLGGVPEAEAGLALWRLAALAHADRQTESALASGGSWAGALAKLLQTQHGRQFVGAWNAFMSEHGHHCRGELELFNARWSETPDYILGLVRGYLRSIDQFNPLENQQRLAEDRRHLTEQCRRRLKNPIKRWLFSRSLRRAQKLAVNREEWKNQAVRQITVWRRVLLTLGQRLNEQGILSERDDIFFLEVSEIEPVATGKACFDVRERIGSRRKEYETNLALKPPPVVVGKFSSNTPTAPTPDGNLKVLEGIPVSPGTATGRAKVILRSNDHEQVLSGEILIAPFTDPAWTPYFIAAAGVVMDQGGILSHGSIVAREYGLPAVTNVGSATRLIRTGDLVQVDGDNGRVTVLERVAGNHGAGIPQRP